MKFFDTHAHVNFSAFKDDGEEILKKSLAGDVFVVNVGSQYSTSQRAVEYAHKFDKETCPHTKADTNEDNIKDKVHSEKVKNFGVGVYAAVGIHPLHLKEGSLKYQDPGELSETEINPALSHEVLNSSENIKSFVKCGIKTQGEKFEYEKYLKLAKDEKVVAIGEVGLDYHHFEPEDDIEELKKVQKETLIKFIELANEVDKPVMIHCWDGYADLLEILKTYPVNKKGIIHSFVGSWKTANLFIELGYKIGLNGIVTYGDSYDKLIREIPLENIVIETDCPYLAPVPHKGERNEPLFVKLVAEKIAAVKNITIEEVAKITTKNAELVFGKKF